VQRVDDELDITAEVCPMTFVRTKLKLEAMAPGSLLRVRLRGEEPLYNVPRALLDHGHAILDIRRHADGSAELIVRKSG
jgi:TusA-related sulfurtransferase